jgi:hypothetical protein
MRKKILYIISNNFNMEGKILGYYFVIMGCVAFACWVCPIIKKRAHRICCESSDEEYDEEYDEEEMITPLASPSSSTSSEGTYELALKPDYSSSDEFEDRYVRVKVYNTQPNYIVEDI